jgi:LysM repeat protein
LGCNDKFYGRPTTPGGILFGQTVPSNKGVQDLHRKLELLAERSFPKVSVTVQTQTAEESFNEYETVQAQTLEENTNWNEITN